MDIDCPKCEKNNEVDGEDLPERACDDAIFKCLWCDHDFSIGWFAEIELR